MTEPYHFMFLFYFLSDAESQYVICMQPYEAGAKGEPSYFNH